MRTHAPPAPSKLSCVALVLARKAKSAPSPADPLAFTDRTTKRLTPLASSAVSAALERSASVAWTSVESETVSAEPLKVWERRRSLRAAVWTVASSSPSPHTLAEKWASVIALEYSMRPARVHLPVNANCATLTLVPNETWSSVPAVTPGGDEAVSGPRVRLDDPWLATTPWPPNSRLALVSVPRSTPRSATPPEELTAARPSMETSDERATRTAQALACV